MRSLLSIWNPEAAHHAVPSSPSGAGRGLAVPMLPLSSTLAAKWKPSPLKRPRTPPPRLAVALSVLFQLTSGGGRALSGGGPPSAGATPAGWGWGCETQPEHSNTPPSNELVLNIYNHCEYSARSNRT